MYFIGEYTRAALFDTNDTEIGDEETNVLQIAVKMKLVPTDDPEGAVRTAAEVTEKSEKRAAVVPATAIVQITAEPG